MLCHKQGMVGVMAPPCVPRRDSSSALETKLQPEAMSSSQYQAYPEKCVEAPGVREGTSTVDMNASVVQLALSEDV